jgi:hypothetical protein
MLPARECADKRYVFGGFALRFIPCEGCGISVAKSEYAAHVCEPDRRIAYQMIQHQDDLVGVEKEIRSYLESPKGRFESWYAERTRRLAS